MKKSVSIEKLPGGYSVRFWEASHRKREWFQDYKLAQRFAANKKISLLAKAQSIVDPTLKPLDILHSYLQALSSNPNYRQATIVLKFDTLHLYCTGLPSMEYLSPKKMLAYMQDKKYSPNGVAMRLRELRAFNNWCVNEGYLKTNLFVSETPDGKKIKFSIPGGEDVGRKLELHEIKALLLNSSDKLKLFLAFITYHGSRFGETYKTEKQHLDLANGIWTIPKENNKAKREKKIPINPYVLDLLKKTELPEGRIFPANNLYRMFRQAVKKAGIEGRLRPHDMRHNFVSYWQGDPRILMDMVGWTTTAMLKRYSHFTVENIRKEAETKGLAANLNM